MQTHPVPQNIASYEFKLVGDMTLKQFMFLAIGALLGLAVWNLPIPFSIIRFALAIIPVGGGILAAFVPIQGRPFAAWVNAFFKAIYAPTIYDYAAPVEPKVIAEPTLESKTPTTTPAMSFSAALTQAVKAQKQQQEESTAPPLIVPNATPAPATNEAAGKVESKETTTSKVVSPPPTPIQTTPTQPEPSPTRPNNMAPIISEDAPLIPTEKPSSTPRLTPIDSTNQVKVVTNPSPITHNPSPSAPAASLTSSIATPTLPNILTGLVVDPNQVSIASATVEIIDSKTGIPTRALRTNRLGQFQIAIPLPNGKYTLQAEKEGLNFSPVSITVNNSIIKPVLIAATSSTTPTNSVPSSTPNQVTKF